MAVPIRIGAAPSIRSLDEIGAAIRQLRSETDSRDAVV
jgi:hypothetical protein